MTPPGERRWWPGVLVGVAVGLLVVCTVAPDAGRLMPDVKPEIYLAPGRSLRDYLAPWQDNPGMGMPSFNVGLAPVCAVVWVIEALGAPPWLAARLLRVILLVLAGWGAAALVRARVPAWARSWAPLAAACLFVTFPYTLVGGSTLPVLLPLATLPWLVHFVLRSLGSPRPARWAAAAGLAFAAGSGMNAGVVPLLQLLAVPVAVLYAWPEVVRDVRRAALTLLQCAGWTVLLSLYWVVPTLGARGAGGTVVANSESLAAISVASSLAEVLRGLGLWTMYGGDAGGPWQPGFTPYLDNAVVATASFVLPAVLLALGAYAARPARRAATVLVLGAAALMLGGFPVARPGLLGRALTRVFDTFPAAAAFRTTNKVGSVLVLGLVVLGAAGLVGLWARHRPTPLLRRTLTATLVVAAVVAAVPLWTGGTLLGPYSVPAYWKAAGKALSAAPADERVWMVPGERLANYRWTAASPDDVGRALFSVPTVVRTTTPNGSPEAANLLAAADLSLGDPAAGPGVVAAYARLLGAGTVLARNDLAYEQSGGLSPRAVATRLATSTGLAPGPAFGPPGTNTGPAGGTTPGLLPLQAYAVDAPVPILRTATAASGVLLAGDGFGFAALQDAGLLGANPLVSYLATTSPDRVASALRHGARIVLTDTNRRRLNDVQRLADGQGPLLAAGETVPSTLALGTAADQTTLVVLGGGASASPLPGEATIAEGVPENAFDGNLDTAWEFGSLFEPVRRTLTRTFSEPVTLSRVVVRTADLGSRRIDTVRVSAAGVSRAGRVDAEGTVTVDLGGVRADRLSVGVVRATGPGVNRLGISEVDTGAPPLVRVARLPDVSTALPTGPGTADALVDRAPVDVLLRRAQGREGTADDEETGLDRDLTLPRARNYFVAATVRATPSTPDSDLDRLAGHSGAVQAQGSSRAFGLPTLRGSQALDGKEDTAWIPSGSGAGETLTVTSRRPVTLDRMTVVQVGPRGTPVQRWATRAEVLVDGRAVAAGPLSKGSATIRFPAVSGRVVQLRLLEVDGAEGLVRISELRAGGLTLHRDPAGDRCVDVLDVDGHPLRMRPQRPLLDLSSRPWVTCRGVGLPLAAGPHTTRARSGWSVDTLDLRDSIGIAAVPTPPPPVLTVTRSGPTAYSATAAASTAPYAVVLGEGRAAGWSATVDGRPLPAPAVVDGFGMGWLVDGSTAPRHIEIRYGPATGAAVAGVVSLAALLVALALALGLLALPAVRAVPWVSRPRPPSPRRRHRPTSTPSWGLGTAALVTTGLLLGGVRGLAVGLLVGLVAVLRPSAPTWYRAAAVLLLVTAEAWFLGNHGRWGTVSPDLVTGNLWPHYVALAVVLCLLAGLLAPEPGAADAVTDPSEEPAP